MHQSNFSPLFSCYLSGSSSATLLWMHFCCYCLTNGTCHLILATFPDIGSCGYHAVIVSLAAVQSKGPKACSETSSFCFRILYSNFIPSIWRKAKTITISKPDELPKSATSYCPLSLLSVCYKQWLTDRPNNWLTEWLTDWLTDEY